LTLGTLGSKRVNSVNDLVPKSAINHGGEVLGALVAQNLQHGAHKQFELVIHTLIFISATGTTEFVCLVKLLPVTD